MQHKQRRSLGRPQLTLFFAGLVLAAIAGVISLAFVEIEAPQHEITQELDAKAILQSK